MTTTTYTGYTSTQIMVPGSDDFYLADRKHDDDGVYWDIKTRYGEPIYTITINYRGDKVSAKLDHVDKRVSDTCPTEYHDAEINVMSGVVLEAVKQGIPSPMRYA